MVHKFFIVGFSTLAVSFLLSYFAWKSYEKNNRKAHPAFDISFPFLLMAPPVLGYFWMTPEFANMSVQHIAFWFLGIFGFMLVAGGLYVLSAIKRR